jgi:hypothetical protein
MSGICLEVPLLTGDANGVLSLRSTAGIAPSHASLFSSICLPKRKDHRADEHPLVINGHKPPAPGAISLSPYTMLGLETRRNAPNLRTIMNSKSHFTALTIGTHNRLFAEAQPAPDATSFRVDNTGSQYYESPYFLAGDHSSRAHVESIVVLRDYQVRGPGRRRPLSPAGTPRSFFGSCIGR